MKADPMQDRVLVDAQPLALPETLIYLAIYKPRGVLSTVSAPDPRPTIRDLVDLPGNFYPVGRLDVDSEGLMLLTNDGDLANRLTHPRYGHEKEYRVLVARRPDDQQLQTWRRGVVLPDGYRTAPAEVSTAQPSGKGMWLRVVLKEGRKRQIRETGSTLGLPVVKIIRVRIGSLYLGELKPRQWRALSADEVKDLQSGKKPIAVPRRRPPRVHTRQADTASQNRSASSRPSDKRESTHRTSSKGTSPKGASYGRSSSGRPPSSRSAHPRPSSGKPPSRRKPTGGKPSVPKAHPSPQKTSRSKKP